MNECCYKITLKNGKEYIVATIENNINKFVTNALKPNTVGDYKLHKEYMDNNIRFNTVMILSSEISSIEYAVEY